MQLQDNRFGTVITSLGVDKLLFSKMNGHEEMGRLFEYEVELFSTEKYIDINQILGQSMTIDLEMPNQKGSRYYNGLVTQFRHLGTSGEYFLYRAVLHPWFWFLTRTSNCRIFQEKSVPDIIKKIFELNGFSDFKVDLTGNYPVREYCVQYRESDFNFISRLMEYEGIYYFFSHEQNKHTLVIADSISSHNPIEDYEVIDYFPPENKGQRSKDHIFEWHNYHEVQSGSCTLNDFDFKKPKNNLIAKHEAPKSHTYATGEWYDYPGEYYEPDLGDHYANVRLNEFHSNYEVIKGRGNAMGLTSGMLFTLKNHYLTQENTSHILVAANFYIESNFFRSDETMDGVNYECSFEAIRSQQQFRPSRITPIPFVQGPQTATVCGKEGEEIWTDQHGRIKVQFHWDRDGKENENSSCWMRVSYPIAGKNWGWVSIPRIGQEVLVGFLEGNPDRPLVVGGVYNANQMPPYDLPANQTQSGMKSRSTKQGVTDNFNEIRFEDKKDSEEVYVHAEKNFNCVIENNETRKIGLDKKDKGNQTVEIQNDRKITLNEGNDTLQVKMGNRETMIDKGNHQTTVGQGNDTTEVQMGDHSIKVGMGKSTIEAMTSIELKVGGNSIKIDQAGITIKGLMVKIQGEVTLDLKSVMTTVNGDGMLTLKGGLTMIN